MPEQTEYRYYSTQRPVDIGTYPRSPKPVDIVNYDGRIAVEDGAFIAWGHLVYDTPLHTADLEEYELRASPSNPPPNMEAAQDTPDKPEPPDPDGPGGATYSQDGNTPEPEDNSYTENIPALTAADVPAIANALAGSSITPDEVDAVLRDGGNEDRTLHRIAAYYMKDKPLADNADFLRREHVARYRHVRESGKGFQFGNDKLSVWFGSDGITLGRGETALRASDRVHLTWEQAAVRVRELLDAGQYMNGDLLDEAIGNEHRELADRLLFFYRDDLRDWRGMPEGWRTERGGWPDDVEHLKKLLDDPVEYGRVLARVEGDIAALHTDPDAPRRFWHDPNRLLQDVRDAGIEPHMFSATDFRPPAAMRFITQDEIDAYFIKRGSDFHSGKYRILSYFLQDHTPKERAAFLKKETGHGGHSHALGGADDSWADYEPGKGIKLQRGSVFDEQAYDIVKLTWSAAEKRIMGLINEGRYMSRAELDHIPAYEVEALARQIQNFYYNLPPDFERPFPYSGFIDDEATQAICDMLEGGDRGAGLLAAMTPIMEGTAPDDRLYEVRKTAFDSLTAYRAGTFSLFPGLDALPPSEAVAAPPRKLVEQAPEQLSLFSESPPASAVTPPLVLRGVEEQQVRIEQAIVIAEREPEPPAADIISQDEIDALLLGAVETISQFDAILAAFAQNPRLREAVQLVKDVYSDGVYLSHRIDGAEGYMGLMGDASGVTLSKNDPLTVPKEERQPAISIDLTWPKVHRRIAELVESGRFLEARNEPPTFHSPQRFIPYREGDSVDALSAGAHTRLVLVAVDEGYIYYTMPDDHSEQEPVNMLRSRFEGYLDNGSFRIMEPGTYLPSRDVVEAEVAESGQAENALDNAPPTAETTDRAFAEDLLQRLAGLRVDPTEYFNEHHSPGMDFDRAATIRGFLHRAREEEIRSQRALPEDRRMPSPLPVTSNAWDGAEPSHKIEIEGNRYLLLMRNRYAEHQPVIIDDENGYELRRFHYKTDDEQTGHVLAYCAQEAGLLIPAAAYVITYVEPIAGEDEAQQTTPGMEQTIESGRPYTVGEAIYLEHDKPYVISAIDYEVRLHEADTARPVPITRSMSFHEFEYALRRNERNRHITDYLPTDLSVDYDDLIDVLENGLLSPEHKETVSAMLHSGAANSRLVKYLADNFPNEAESMTLETGDTADYFTTPRGIQIEIQDSYSTKRGYSWNDVAPVVRALNTRGWRDAELITTEPEVEPDFDTVAQTVLARVMQDVDYLADLAAAPSRASLRNPCTWALEQAIRNHEQDEPAVFHKYFYDDDWNDRLFAYVLRESYAGRPQPEIAPALQPQENQSGTELDDDFSDIDPAAIRERLENPTPEDEARLADMLAFAEQAAADFDAELGIEPDTRSEQDIIDDALREWNGVVDSKALVYQYMRDHGRERETAAFLQTEFAEYAENVADNSVFHIPMPDGEAQRLPWPKVQRRIAQLIEQGVFLTPDEQEYVEREFSFDESGAYDGPTRDDLIRSEIQDRMDLLDPEDDEVAEPDSLQYEVGDTVFLEGDREFIIDAIGENSIHLQDVTFQRGVGFPIFRDIHIGEFERLVRDNPQNSHMLGSEEPVWRETDGGETTRVMFDLALNTGESETPGETVETPLPPARNYRITDDALGAGGPKTRFAANIAAIRTLKQIEAEGRGATQPEQEILARYVGWGGLANAFDDGAESWQKEYAELKGILTSDEYAKARASVLNAHYTPPVVIKAIYDAIGQMGFKRGNVLEPACGTGNFFGLLPEQMKGAKLYGVELDDISARIAEKLYPSAAISNTGFEKTNFPDSFFDVAVGNVPFGDYKVYDQDYNRKNFYIHDYFIAKSIDKVRSGGVVALVTSNGVSGGTFDKRDSKARRYMAERCDLIGAIRLPDNTFKAAAGIDMTTDILFLQKRDIPRNLSVDMPDWVGVNVVHEHQHDDGSGEIRNNVLTLNNYYREHPEMVLGDLQVESGPFGPQLSCKPKEGEALSEQLREAISHLQAEITEDEPSLDDLGDGAGFSVAADTNVKNFSYALVTPVKDNGEWYAAKLGEGDVFFRENSRMYRVELPATTLERIRGMVELRDCVHKLIDLQLNDYADFAIEEQQQRLDRLYDAFVAEYGLINSVANNRAFSSDSAYYLLCSLEILDEDNNLERKADMFTKRTIKQRNAITSVDTASEALAVSIGERARVDLDYMSELSGLSREKLIEDLHGVIFLNVGGADTQDKAYVTADEYLSGNIREKLINARAAASVNPSLAVNVEALEQAMPKDLTASEISVRLGSTWIDKSIFQQFMFELLQSSYSIKNALKINYSALTGEWQVANKARVPYSDIAAHVTYGTGRVSAYEIIEDTLNLRDVRVYDTKMEDGKEKRVLNRKETTLAQQKQEQIKQAFKDWVWQDPQRRQRLVRQYNDLFNSNRVREYDGSHIVFSGMNPEFTLRPYQQNAIARILYGGNTLLAHEVGAGKTFEMVAAAMEGKRLGLCSKSMFAVPNHIIDQIASDFLRLYPSANILVAQKKDFEKRNRKKFCAKIATGDYDAVIIGHSQLEKIPISVERQERLLQEQLWEVLEGIDEAKRSKGERFTVKQLERTKRRLESRLEKIREGKGRDDVVTFEQLGVDRLFVDEAHNYKNLFLYTKMRNVAGLSTTEAQKSNDLFLKCRYMDELTGGKGVIFATGTPVSNSMTELYTMQRYLQYENLERKNLIHFDSWASTFGETVTAMELAPEGTGYRARTRFSRFHNLPELMGMFCEVADIKTSDMLDLVRPDAHYETVVVQPSELQQEMVQALSERAAEVHTGRVDPKEDNMLKITSDGRKIGLDQRLIDPMLPDFEGSKVNACLEGVHKVWADTKSDRLAQLVFCDFSTPNKDGRFNVYDDIKAKLVEKGIPEHEIAFIHDANTDQRKKELFAKVRKGQVRVLFGSTFKMGAGTNVQDKLIAMHDLDCPWRPADLEQRAGRIVRFGNQNPDVYIYRYVTEGTFDAYLWQTVENKQKFISQIMTSKSPVRSCEDVDETALSYAEIKALCSGNPLIKEKIDLDIEVSRLRLLKSEHQSQHHRLEDDLLENFPKNIKSAQENIAGLERDMARLAANTPKAPPVLAEPVAAGTAEAEVKPEAAKAPFPPMTVLGTTHTEKAAAGEALLEACKSVKGIEPVPVGSYMGFDMSISFNAVAKKFRLTLKGDMSYSVDMGVDPMGNLTRISHALKVDMPERLTSNRTHLENLHQQVEAAKVELAKPFGMEKELAEKEMRLALVNAELNIEEGPAPMEAAASLGEAVSAKARPSILDGLHSRTETGITTPRQDKTAGAEISM